MTNKNLKPKTYNSFEPEGFQSSSRLSLSETNVLNGLKPNRGFAMLFSVLISSLLVVIGLSIFNITLKELTISTSSRESQIAFYAANSGMECALYWNLKQNAFATSTGSAETTRVTPIVANCNTVDVNNGATGNTKSATTKFTFNVTSDSNGPCVEVEVTKTDDQPITGQRLTEITSQGKNICGTSGRRVERGLRASITTEM